MCMYVYTYIIVHAVVHNGRNFVLETLCFSLQTKFTDIDVDDSHRIRSTSSVTSKVCDVCM